MQILLDIILFLVYSITFVMLCVYCYNFFTSIFILSNSTNNILLEIKIPRDVFKSPEATEIALLSLLQGSGVATWYKRNILGNGVATFSLEIASLEGQIHFYIRTQTKFRQLVENNFYANYPGIEIVEAPDYVSQIYYDHRSQEVNMWGLENKLGETFNLLKNKASRLSPDIKDDDLKMPADALPIKTYVDYGMDKDPKDFFKHDPLALLLEWMGSIGQGEYIWHQIILQDSGKFNGKAFSKTYFNEKTGEDFTFNELTDELIKSIRTRVKSIIKVNDIVYDEYGHVKKTTELEEISVTQSDGTIKKEKVKKEVPLRYGDNFFNNDEKTQGYKVIEEEIKNIDMTVEKQDKIKAILRKKAKPIMRAIIRTIYIAKKENFNASQNINSILSYSKPFGPTGYNSFAPSVMDKYEYEWQNTKGRRVPWHQEFLFLEYMERGGMFSHLETRDKESTGFFAGLLGIFPFSIGSYSMDKWFDVYFFKHSMRTRFIIRSLIEKFFYPFHHPRVSPMTLNLEEIATLWHIPASNITSPGIRRIGLAKSSFPDHLPR